MLAGQSVCRGASLDAPYNKTRSWHHHKTNVIRMTQRTVCVQRGTGRLSRLERLHRPNQTHAPAVFQRAAVSADGRVFLDGLFSRPAAGRRTQSASRRHRFETHDSPYSSWQGCEGSLHSAASIDASDAASFLADTSSLLPRSHSPGLFRLRPLVTKPTAMNGSTSKRPAAWSILLRIVSRSGSIWPGCRCVWYHGFPWGLSGAGCGSRSSTRR